MKECYVVLCSDQKGTIEVLSVFANADDTADFVYDSITASRDALEESGIQCNMVVNASNDICIYLNDTADFFRWRIEKSNYND